MRRFAVALMGGTVLLAGIVMLVMPGPGLPLILVAVAILATEFLWARLWLGKCRRACDRIKAPRKARAWLRWLTRRSAGSPLSSARRPAQRSTAGPTPLPRWLP